MAVAMHATLLTLSGAVYREVEVPTPPPLIVEAPELRLDGAGRASWKRRTFVREPAAGSAGHVVYREQPATPAPSPRTPQPEPRPWGGRGRRAA
jgi:hypothetical protein